jgi:hypothetical protein
MPIIVNFPAGVWFFQLELFMVKLLQQGIMGEGTRDVSPSYYFSRQQTNAYSTFSQVSTVQITRRTSAS